MEVDESAVFSDADKAELQEVLGVQDDVALEEALEDVLIVVGIG